MPFRKRKDKNQKSIVRLFESLGCRVHVTSNLGAGFPDIVVSIASMTVPVEIKAKRKSLSHDQRIWHAQWEGLCAVVRTEEDVNRLVSTMKEAGKTLEKSESQWSEYFAKTKDSLSSFLNGN